MWEKGDWNTFCKASCLLQFAGGWRRICKFCFLQSFLDSPFLFLLHLKRIETLNVGEIVFDWLKIVEKLYYDLIMSWSKNLQVRNRSEIRLKRSATDLSLNISSQLYRKLYSYSDDESEINKTVCSRLDHFQFCLCRKKESQINILIATFIVSG